MKCSTARRVIDEVDNPANLPYKTAGHLEGCTPCRQFAGEREQLRKLLLEPLRVSAPANFDAMVARRLAKRFDQKRPFWLAGGFYLRAAGGAAALACLILVAQVTMFRHVAPTSGQPPPQVASATHESTTDRGTTVAKDKPVPFVALAGTGETTGLSAKIGKPRGASVRVTSEGSVTAAITNMMIQPRAILLVRNPGSEREIAVPMVSVGAQPWLSVSLQSPDERGVRAAF